jgi:hypothetical protein
MVHDALPDAACTPGAIFPDASSEQICKPGYSSSVRNVPAEVTREVYASYGVVERSPGHYEVDHLVPLEIGGSNDIANLWPQAAEPPPGFHEKDRVENYLHDPVCAGHMQLIDAQRMAATDWVAVYESLPAMTKPTPSAPRPAPTPQPQRQISRALDRAALSRSSRRPGDAQAAEPV